MWQAQTLQKSPDPRPQFSFLSGRPRLKASPRRRPEKAKLTRYKGEKSEASPRAGLLAQVARMCRELDRVPTRGTNTPVLWRVVRSHMMEGRERERIFHLKRPQHRLSEQRTPTPPWDRATRQAQEGKEENDADQPSSLSFPFHAALAAPGW